jgi:hypothetical protein
MSSPRKCYWIVTNDSTGHDQTLIFGSDISEEEARMKGLQDLPGIDFVIKALRTRNLARASSLIKGEKLDKYHDLSKATEKLHHTTKFGKHKPNSKSSSRGKTQYQNQHDPW